MSWVKRAFPAQFVHVCYESYRAAFSEKNRHVAFRHAVKYFLPAVYPLRIKIGARILVSRLVSSKCAHCTRSALKVETLLENVKL